MSTIEPTTGTGAQALNMPMNEKSATTEPFGDQKFDPSVGSQTLSHPNGTAPTSELQSAPTSGLQSAPAANTSELAPATAPVEHAAEVPSTTTTTIITTTTGPASNGSGIASPTSATSDIAAAPVAAQNGSAVSPTGAALGGGAAGAAGGAALANHEAKKEEKKAPVSMTPKDAKKYNKVLASEAKNEEKEIAAAIKTAQSNEKALRKAKKAEAQSGSRHSSAVKDEHNYSKALNKATLSHEKATAALRKAEEELEIKKRHTATQNDAYESIKQKIESLRKKKMANDKDRASRHASVA